MRRQKCENLIKIKIQSNSFNGRRRTDFAYLADNAVRLFALWCLFAVSKRTHRLNLGPDVATARRWRPFFDKHCATLCGSAETCSLSRRISRQFYNSEELSWNVTSNLLRRLENDWRLLLNCTPDGGTWLLSFDEQIRPPDVILITQPLTIRSATRPSVFTCPQNQRAAFAIL